LSDAGAVFREIYATRKWGEGSGGGSIPKQVAPYLRFLDGLILKLKPTRVLDIGCGFGWMAGAVNWRGARYIGVDVVSSVIEEASHHLVGDFHVLDAITDQLPDADLVILKEVTQHLDNNSILKLLQNLESYPTVLHCSIHEGQANGAIKMGETRSVDLGLEPFNIPCEDVFNYQIAGSHYQCQLWRPANNIAR